mmetsp:Transcript_20569/g.62070  ORF Transcript_20569/g.62070 Transcript_20569/m.62070 type:complete len:205 (-) Transcript_20569:55-669(-)
MLVVIHDARVRVKPRVHVDADDLAGLERERRAELEHLGPAVARRRARGVQERPRAPVLAEALEVVPAPLGGPDGHGPELAADRDAAEHDLLDGAVQDLEREHDARKRVVLVVLRLDVVLLVDFVVRRALREAVARVLGLRRAGALGGPPFSHLLLARRRRADAVAVADEHRRMDRAVHKPRDGRARRKRAPIKKRARLPTDTRA